MLYWYDEDPQKSPLTKLLRIYRSKLKMINYRQKIDKFIVSIRRYRGLPPIKDTNDK